MKCIKMLGLAAVAAAALMAFAGAGTASAESTLCKAEEEPCSEGNMYPAGTTLSFQLKSGKTMSLNTGAYEVSCSKSEIKGNTETTTTPGGKNEALSFSECTAAVQTESVGTFKIHSYEVEVESGKGTGGVSVIRNGNFTTTGVSFKFTQAGVTCIYGGNVTVMMVLLGGSPATLLVDSKFARQTGSSFFCAAEAGWGAEYEAKTPSPLYISTGV